MSDEQPLDRILDLRELGDKECAELEHLALRALFDFNPSVREDAIAELQETCPNIVGAYATNRLFLILRECETDNLLLGYLADVKEPQRSLKSHPFYDGND